MPVVGVYSTTTFSQCFCLLKKMAKELTLQMCQQMYNMLQYLLVSSFSTSVDVQSGKCLLPSYPPILHIFGKVLRFLL
jgi:hypothetical protein